MVAVVSCSTGAFSLGLLPAPLGELLLRIHGGTRDAQVARAEAPRCLIGSDATCGICITDDGIQPFQCAISQGKRGAVVSCCSPTTRLNGQPFASATLEKGDRLQFGNLEMEIVEMPIPSWELNHEPMCELTSTDASPRTLATEVALGSLRPAGQTDPFSRAFETLRQGRTAISPQPLPEEDLPEIVLALEAEEERWVDDQDELSSELAGAGFNLLLAQQAFSEERIKWAEELAAHVTALDDCQQSLQSLQKEFTEWRSQSESEREQWIARLTAAEAEHHASEARVVESKRLQERAQDNYVELQLQLQTSQQETQESLVKFDQAENEIRRLREVVVSRDKQLDEFRQTAHESVSKLQSDLNDFRDKRAQLEAQLVSTQAALQQVQVEFNANSFKQQEPSQLRQGLTAEAEFAALHDELKDEQTNSHLDHPRTISSGRTSRPSEPIREIDRSPRTSGFAGIHLPAASESNEKDLFDPPADCLQERNHETQNPDCDVPTFPSWLNSRSNGSPLQTNLIDEDRFISHSHPYTPLNALPGASSLTQPHNDEEDSIQEYMNRLLERVRGDSAPVDFTPTAYDRRTTPTTEIDVPIADSSYEAASEEIVEPTVNDYMPRSRTRESCPNIAVMRKLANEMASSAIHTSRHKSRAQLVRNKFVRAGVTLTTTASIMFVFQSSPILFGISAGLGMFVSGLFLFQMFRLPGLQNHDVAASDRSRQAQQVETETAGRIDRA